MPWTSLIFILPTIISMSTISPVTCVNECLKDVKEVTPPRSFQIKNEIHNITLESSGSLGHRLITEAFRIFLLEVLGYEAVNVIVIDDRFDAKGALNRLEGHRVDFRLEKIPEAIINLGIWLSSDVDLAEWTSRRGYVESCGNLGFSGRFGWFTLRNSSLLRSRPHLNLDYWRTYAENSDVTRLFSLNADDMHNVTLLSRDVRGTFYCTESYCKDGIYEADICQGKDTCALLLSSFPGLSPQLPEEISSLGLYIRVAYLGPNLDPFVRYLLHKYEKENVEKGVLFFTWKPTLLTTDFDLLTVSLPVCNEDSFCDYESGKLEKVISRLLIGGGGKLAHEATQLLSLTLEEYTSFMSLYQKESLNGNVSLSSVACDWLRSNAAIWRTWYSVQEVEKPHIYIGGIFPISGGYTDPGIVVAADMAKEAVNYKANVLKDYSLQLYIFDGQCRADKVMKTFIDYIRHSTFPTMAGILGPACSDTVEPLAGVATHFKTVVISYSAEGSSFSDRETYPYFFRTIGQNKQYLQVYLKLFQGFGWARVASLTEEGQKYAEYVSHLQDLLQQNNIAFVANRKFPKEALNMSQYLEDLKSKKAKIIIGDFYDHQARAIMCEAYRQKMTADEGYVWFLPTWFVSDWYDTDRYNSIGIKEHIPCDTSQMIQAINGHLSLQHAYFAPNHEVMQEEISVGQWRNKYMEMCKQKNVAPSDYGGYAYDAVWTYAYALDKLLHQNHSHIANFHTSNTTDKFVELIKKTDFHGVSGHIKFVDGTSRLSTIIVSQWIQRQKTIVGTFAPFLTNNNTEQMDDLGELHLNQSAIVWLNPEKSVPSDGSELPPTCVLHTLASALDISCEAAIVVANVSGFGILGLILLVCFVVIKRRYERRVQLTEDYMKALGIDISTVSNASALDKWEIPRDRLVINRKIGEGAFGFVYGGECYVDEKTTWVAVAVKTLKSGSTVEHKLEFLGEAEVMKRFDHKNILKLLGVQTKGEPVTMVMEYMLYGDLKTFLLSRRNFVDERTSEESDDISSKRLTSMALDIARAISYLAELKYVHRDIACRNCLLTSNRVVKLGDFGMTRSMYENDYYRFNRKGLLPVRWMPPESLALGRFTPASDVWSFGVVLYEIVTFGSYPFQGLSNNQVLEYVKAGKTLNIPHGIKPELTTLLQSMWTFEPPRRPHASEIVEFLANNPRIIAPSLELPLASVQIEGPDVHEVQVSRKRQRKRHPDTNSPPPELIPLTITPQTPLLLNI